MINDIGFDQFGSLFGEITLHNDTSNDVVEINLPGMRFVREIIEDQLTELRSLNKWKIIGVCKDGLVFTLLAKDVENVPNIYSGCIRKPCMATHILKETDLNLNDINADMNGASFTFRGFYMLQFNFLHHHLCIDC